MIALGRGSGWQAPPQQESIGAQVDGHDQASQEHLVGPCQAGRVDDRDQVVLDETARISLRPPHPAKANFKRSQGTNSTRDFDPCSPKRAWDVNPNHLGTAVCRERAQHHEHNEGEVKNDYDVGQQQVDHRSHIVGLSILEMSCLSNQSALHRIGTETVTRCVMTRASCSVNGPLGAMMKSAAISTASARSPVHCTPGRPDPVVSRPW